MDGLAVIGAVFFLIVVGYIGVSAVLRRIPATSLRLPTGPIPDTWDGIVEHNVPLARGLSSDERERLLRLVQVFLTEKHFEGCGGLTLTEEMKVTIAAEACLLLLHLEGPCYPGLHTVLVYPHGFVPKFAHTPRSARIPRSTDPLRGESWRDGVVVISWDDAVRGAHDAFDGSNVVLHEFAHQLDSEDGFGDGEPVLPGSAVRTWGRVLSEEYQRLRADVAADRDSVLDGYGATNKAEFFAVATETSFEKPVQLERDHPELYAQLRQFYGQDPARRAPPGRAGQGGARAHGMGRPLAHRAVRHRPSVPDPRGGGAAGRGGRRVGRDRLAQHRRRGGRCAARPHAAARRRHSDRGAPVRVGGAARPRIPVFRRAGEGAGDGELSG